MGVLMAFLTGAMVPVQTAANARLRSVVGYAFVSTLISFSVSSLSLVLVSFAFRLPVLPSGDVASAVPWWGWCGGLIALCTITSFILLFRALGQLQAMILPIFGQLVFSMVIDHFGIFGVKDIPLSLARCAGLGAAVAGIALTVVKPSSPSRKRPRLVVIWQIAGVATGFGVACIGAIYARLGAVLGSPIQASTVSFLIATGAILAFSLMTGKVTSVSKAVAVGGPWWMWLGGIIGATAVFINAWIIPSLGVGLFMVLLLAGQIAAGVAFENFGWLGAAQRRITLRQYGGIALVVAGAALMRFF